MAAPRKTRGGCSSQASVSVDGVWRGENDEEAEYCLGQDQLPSADAGVWSRPEAEQIYRRRLVTLKELYRGQLSRVRYQLKEKRRQFLLQWQREGGQKSQVLDPALATSPFDAAVCSYSTSSGEIGLLQRKRHMKRLRRTVEMLNSGQTNAAYSTQRHEQLVRLKHKSMKQQPCAVENCMKTALPLAKYCKLHILQEADQFLYMPCVFAHNDKTKCAHPVPAYKQPALCAEHTYLQMKGSSSYGLQQGQGESTSQPVSGGHPSAEQDMSEDPLPNPAPLSGLEQTEPVQPDTQDTTSGTPPEVPTNVTSPMSTDSAACGRSHDKILALLCSESEAESTDKERDS